MLDAVYIDHQLHDFAKQLGRYDVHVKAGKPVSDVEAREMIAHANRAIFVLEGLISIVDELRYDREKFEKLIMDLDDDHDLVRSFQERLNPVIPSHKELKELSDRVLDGLIKAQNELGLIIATHEA